MKFLCFALFLAVSSSCLLPVAAQPPRGGGGPENSERRGPPAVERYFRQLEAQDPEESQRLRELRRTDPEAFRAELRERVRNRRPPHAENGKGGRMRFPLKEQVEAVQQAETKEERVQAAAVLREAISKRVEQSFAAREEVIAELRSRLEELEARHEAEKQQQEELIDRQMSRLLEERPRQPPEGSRYPGPESSE